MTKLNIKMASILILDSTNYGEWNTRITILLWSRELLAVCKNNSPLDASTTAKNEWNKASFDAVSLISSQVSHRVFIEVVKNYSRNAHLLWTKLKEQYASKKAINSGRVWMQCLNSTYNGNLQEYTDKSRMLMMSLETINIHVPSKIHTFTILTKLSGNPKIHQFIEVLSLNKDLVEEPEIILSKLQDFHKNSQSQEKSSIPLATTALVSESAGPYKITYYCSNGKHNPNCTSYTKEECFAKHPELRPPYCQNNKRKNTFNQNASTHILTAQALVTCRETPLSEMDFIVDCGAMHHMFNSISCFSTLGQTLPLKVCTGDSTSSLLSEGIGTVILLCNNRKLISNNCLFVPKLNCNLISFLRICKEKLTISQENGHFKLESNHQPLI
ncbi:hypothetical protein O181_057911 [Austropuccinia psidii MF-1]|uniref:Retrovirus-related Pol polyprotein from transposon TNT 1-94-like beta-barrel domain-containing protein n=1 Tax=Austropuccinia psidii MF-1 TaxID=1389203 RepID=A0A9Q3EG15_9BASI|nr:hypothetical protein [Austropuccinia psidii MF-1]